MRACRLGLGTLALVCAACGAQPAPTGAAGASRTSASSVGSQRPAPGDYARLVLAEGDRVHVAGRVVAIPGRPVRLCAPIPQGGPGYVLGQEPAPSYCPLGVDVHGVNLAALSARRAKSGAVEGTADIDAVYHVVGGLTVRAQHPVPASQPGPVGRPDRPPCPVPAGGWPVGGQDVDLDLGPVQDYATAHPGSIVMPALLRPSRRQVIAYVLTAADPEPVIAALRPAYGARLCVVRSRYTRAQINQAAAAFAPGGPQTRNAGIFVTGSGGLAPDEQPVVDVRLTLVTPQVALLASRQPAGLVRLYPWLRSTSAPPDPAGASI